MIIVVVNLLKIVSFIMPSRIFLFFILLSPLIAVVAPRFLAFWPLIIGVYAYIHMFFYDKSRLKEFFDVKYLAVILSISFLIILSSLWSVDSMYAFERSLGVFVILLSGFMVWNASKFIFVGNRNVKILCDYYPIMMMVMLFISYLNIEFGLPIYKILNSIDLLQEVNMSKFNRSGIALLILSIPAFMVCWYQKKYILFLLLLTGMFLVSMVTESQSVQLAFIVSILVFILPIGYAFLRNSMALSVILLMIFSPFIMIWMFANLPELLLEYNFFQQSYAGHRLEIWSFVSHYIMINPLYGFGIEGTRLVESFDTQQLYFDGNNVLHPHNLALQVWMEFGLVGILFASALIIAFFKSIRGHIKIIMRFELIMFFALVAISATAYGIWQSWWVGLIILSIAIFRIFSEFIELDSRDN